MTRYRFDQIAENSTAKKKPEESDRDRYVGLEHLDPGTLGVTRWGAEVTPKGDKLLMKKGDVLFGRRRAYQKKVGIAPFDGIFSAHGMVLRPKADVVDPMFFPFFISSDIFLDEAIRVSVGSLSPTANWKDLRTLEFDLPSPGKQRELAGILSEAESLKGHYRKMLTTCDDVVKSQFVEMFGDPASDESRWERKALGETCRIITGNTPSRKDTSNYGDHIEWCKTDNITDAKHLTPAAEMLSEAGAEKGRIAPAGSILMACIAGSISSIGKVAVADRPVAFNQQINAVIPGDALITDYLLWAFKLSKDYLCSNVNMQLKGILNKSALSAKEFPVPPLALQQEFAAFAASVDKSKFAVQKALDELNATTKKIMNQELGLGDV